MKQVFFASLVVLGSYAAAFAHSKSEETTPTDASPVTAVDQIEIRFDDPMRVTAVSLVGPNGDTATLLAKLVLFAGLLSLAARNKFRLVPAMVQSAQAAGKKLRCSTAFEALAIGAILIVTAVLTSVTTPAVNL